MLRGRRPHDKCIRAGRHAANEGRVRSFLRCSCRVAYTRVKGSADGHGIITLPASLPEAHLFFRSTVIGRAIERVGSALFPQPARYFRELYFGRLVKELLVWVLVAEAIEG